MNNFDTFLNDNNIEIIETKPGGKALVKTKFGFHLVSIKSLESNFIPNVRSAIDKTEYFINKSISKHGDRYDYSKSKYIDRKNKITITCKIHGDFHQLPDIHLRGSGCSKCDFDGRSMTLERFKEKLKLISPTLNILSNSIKTRDSVIVSDELGIKYSININSLLKGTIPSINSAIDKNSAFIIKSRSVHGNKYEYPDLKYISHSSKINIICPNHGLFKQRPIQHLRGDGCPECGKIRTINYNKLYPNTWTLSSWIEASKNSRYFDCYKVYILKCWNDDESFIKIGRTYSKLNRRFYSKSSLPYKYVQIYEITGEASYIYYLEIKLKKMCKNYRVIPQIPFDGMQECFSIDCLEILKEKYEHIKENCI